ncbi:DnaJ family molecular chaperone [Rhodanobacter ginsengisoli]|uniref:DnaJ family molecular chaperone n=1 Tax=Rhodanobacter ginsengisoli TaxID=418646 RepID=A0ABW0QRJ5_9GAMM
MTLTQIVIVVAGLFLGYRLVSYMLSPGTGDEGKTSGSSADARPGAGRTQTRGREWNWNDAVAPSVPGTNLMWYQTLGVAESASLAEIDHAYRVQISQYHPDKVARLGADIRRLAEARSKEINAAYDMAIRLRQR